MEINLPDFNDLDNLINVIKVLTIKKLSIEIDIKRRESEIMRIVSTDVKYFRNGKSPAVDYIETAYIYPGLDNELISERLELAETIALLDEAKLRFGILKDKIDIWRTVSANERVASL